MIIVVLSAATGMLVGLLRFPVFSLVPVVVFSAAGAAGSGIFAGASTDTIVLEVLGSIAAPQIAYLPISLAVELIGSSRWASHVRAAIRHHFRAEHHVWSLGRPRRRH
jgi:hypothetical protein